MRTCQVCRFGSVINILVVVVLLVQPGSGTASTETPISRPHSVGLLAGISLSPSPFGGDSDGATFPLLALIVDATSHWAWVLQVEHGRYTDYPSLGPVTLTLSGFGPRYRFRTSGFQPYVQAVPSLAFSRWSGGLAAMNRVRPGLDLGAGVRGPVTRNLALELGGGYILASDAGSTLSFDDSEVALDGLSQYFLRIGLVIELSH